MIDRMADTYGALRRHIDDCWPESAQEEFTWTLGPVGRVLPRFRVRRMAAKDKNVPCAYVTVGSWEATGNNHSEFFILSPAETPRHVETLAMVANLHADERYRLKAGSTIDIGRPWIEGSMADHFLVSPPYSVEQGFEWCTTPSGEIRFLWLVPIYNVEAEFAREHGAAALEQLLEDAGVNVIAVSRQSLV